MKDIIYFVIFFFAVHLGCNFNKNNSKFDIKRTSWTLNRTQNCTDTIKFLDKNDVSYYYCGTGHFYEGNYHFNEDSIFIEILDDISWIDASKGKEVVKTLDLKYENDKLYVNNTKQKYSEFSYITRGTIFNRVNQ